MIIPEKIIGRNKIRDAAICVEFEACLEDKKYLSLESVQRAVAEKFKLCERRILQIVRDNHAYIPIDRAWEKKKRINRLRVEIKQKEKSNKDVADLLEQLRVEIEGDKPLVDNSIHNHFVVFRNPEALKEGSEGKAPISRLQSSPV